MRRSLALLLLIVLLCPVSGLAGSDDFLLGVRPAPTDITPAYRSEYRPDHENCYWCTPMNLDDEEAVWGMLPKNNIARKMMTRLKVFAGPEHTHAAQKPVEIKL